MTNLEQAVLRTIVYADCFEYALTSPQVYHYLISKTSYSYAEVDNALQALVAAQKLFHSPPYYGLFNRKYVAQLRTKTLAASQKKRDLAQKTCALMHHIPWIEGVWLTGNVAMDNAQIQDDIDILVITQHSSVWLTRFIISLTLGLSGKARLRLRKNSSVANKLCFNMYLDSHALAIPESKQNLYTAHEVIQVEPLFSRNQAYERFLAANRWIEAYVPHALEKIRLPSLPPQDSPISGFRQYVNRLLFALQFAYMKRHLSRELVDEHRAFFHPRDTSDLVLSKYQARCQQLGLSSA